MKQNQILAIVLAGASIVPALAHAGGKPVGAVYTQTNLAAGNGIQIFNRYADGHLTEGLLIPTGGQGTGSGLGNQGAVSLSNDQNTLLAVNAGSNSISSFRVVGQALVLTDVEDSGGIKPISVTQFNDLVYVLNAGDGGHAPNIRGFRKDHSGKLSPIPGGEWGLSAPNANPAEILFSPNGRNLVVTEKGTNRVDTFRVGPWGRIVAASFQSSNGSTPFGFDFDRKGRLFVSEAQGGAANGSSLSSYRIQGDLDLDTLTASATTTETAACWGIVSRDSDFAFTANAGSGTISAFRILNNGSVSLIPNDGVSASLGGASHPIDMAVAKDLLYVLANGNPATITGYRIGKTGSLTDVGSVPAATNYSGLAVR